LVLAIDKLRRHAGIDSPDDGGIRLPAELYTPGHVVGASPLIFPRYSSVGLPGSLNGENCLKGAFVALGILRLCQPLFRVAVNFSVYSRSIAEFVEPAARPHMSCRITIAVSPLPRL